MKIDIVVMNPPYNGAKPGQDLFRQFIDKAWRTQKKVVTINPVISSSIINKYKYILDDVIYSKIYFGDAIPFKISLSVGVGIYYIDRDSKQQHYIKCLVGNTGNQYVQKEQRPYIDNLNIYNKIVDRVPYSETFSILYSINTYAIQFGQFAGNGMSSVHVNGALPCVHVVDKLSKDRLGSIIYTQNNKKYINRMLKYLNSKLFVLLFKDINNSRSVRSYTFNSMPMLDITDTQVVDWDAQQEEVDNRLYDLYIKDDEYLDFIYNNIKYKVYKTKQI